jgi:pimeloyl-ACP methyl ester carboxylesterase
MAEQIIRMDGVELTAGAFGDPKNPPDHGRDGIDALVGRRILQKLASYDRLVIRYDQRDTGLSAKYPPGQPGYTFDDLADDAFRILDGYSISAAHLIGTSLGGMIGQAATRKDPSRVLSLTAISSCRSASATSPLAATRGQATLPREPRSTGQRGTRSSNSWSKSRDCRFHCRGPRHFFAATDLSSYRLAD